MFLSHDDESIIALCTPRGSGALALLRLSGGTAISIATAMSKLASGEQLTALPSHTIHLGWVVDHRGDHIDQVLFLLMRAPKTFTGQDVVEISCHNNPFIIETIIQAAIANGARMAKEGEFTRRAVLNDKLDLIQAEAISELIHANTPIAMKKSLAQLEGSFSHWITHLEKDLLKALTFSEASFEFLDEEMEFEVTIKEIVLTALQTIEQLKKTFDQQQQIRQGIRIALIGSVNTGKSSLFNALLHQERSIVTPIPGTTRDVVEAGVYRDGSYWTLIDTAGLRQSHDEIEQEGIRRALEQAHQADIILLIFDGARIMTPQEQALYQELLHQNRSKIILIHNKIDLESFPQPAFMNNHAIIAVSGKEKINLDCIEQALKDKIAALFATIELPFLLNKRQFNLLLEFEKKLTAVQPMLESPIQYELLSYHLQDAIAQLSELTGKTISESCLDEIFREFCVGK